MSEPKRYWMDDQNDADFPYEAVDGEWVKYEDYARLKAEVDAIRQEYSDATNHYNRLHNNLEAQVEQLTKAGDAMACHLVCSDLPNDVCGDLMNKWNAAKEGKQS